MADSVLQIIIRALDDGASTTLRGVETETGTLNATTGALTETMAAGAAAGLGLGVAYEALKVAIIGSADAAISFEQTLVRVQNNTTLTDQDIQTMRQTVLDLAASTGASLQSLTDGFMHVTNITGDATAAMEILRVATASAVATGGDAATTANVLANAMHEYGVDTTAGAQATGEFNSVTDAAAAYMGTLHNAAALGNATLEQFAESSGRAIGIGANLGVSIDDVSAAMVALTKHGLDSANAQTQVVDMMQHIIAPSKTAKDALDAVGKSVGVDLIDDFTPAGLAAKGLNGVLSDLHDALIAAGYSEAQATGEMMQFIPALRGGQGAAILAGTGFGDYNTILASNEQHTANASVSQDALNKMLGTTAGQIDVLKGKFGDLQVAAGGGMNDTLKTLTTDLNQAADNMSTFGSGVRTLTDDLGDSGLAKALGNVGQADQKFSDFLAQSNDQQKATIGATDSLGKSMDGLGNALSGAGAGFAAFNQWLEQSIPGTKALDSAVQSLAGNIGAALGGAASALGSALAPAFASAGGSAGSAIGSGMTAANDRILAQNVAAHEAMNSGGQANQSVYDYVNQINGQAAKSLQDTYTQAIATVTDEQKGIASNIKDENTAIKDVTASYTAQIDPLQRKLDLENQSFAINSQGLKQAIAGVTKEYEDQLQPLQEQATQLKLNLETQSGPLNAAAAAVHLEYDGQITPLQTQLDILKNQYDQQSGPIKQSVEQITAGYNQQIEPLQTQLDHLKTQYDLQSGPIKQAVEQITADYNAQIQPLQDQVTAIKQEYDLQSGPLQQAVDQITLSYVDQIDPLQTQLDLLNAQYAVAAGPLKTSIEQITQSYADQIDPQQHALDLLNQQYTVQSDNLNRSITQVTEQYQAQLEPLQEQLTALQQANDLTNQQIDLQSQITNDRLQQALLDAEGDPTKRAQIAAQLEINKMQEDQLTLVQQQTSLEQQLNGPNLTDAQRQNLQLQLQDTQLKLQLAGMVNGPATDSVVQQQALLTVQQQSAALTRQMADDQQKLAEIPLEQQIRQVTAAQEDALAPLQQQLQTLKDQHDLEAQGMQQAIDDLKNQEYDRLTPLQQQLANLTLQHDLAIGPLTTAITSLKSQEEQRLAPMQEQLKMLQLQYNTAVGPLNLAIEGLKGQEAARLEPMQDQLTQLQLQYNLATGPLTLAIEGLKGKEADRLRPIQDQLTQLQLQYNLATGPLTLAVEGLQTAEKNRLTPIQQQLSTLQEQYTEATANLQPAIDVLTNQEKEHLKPLQDQLTALQDQHTEITTHLQGDIAGLKQNEQDALKPLQDQLQTYQDMNTQLGDLIQGWKDLASAQGAASSAIGAASAGFHAPGKGALMGQPTQVFTPADFQSAGQQAISAYTGVYGSNAAQQWAKDATANAAAGKGAGNIDTLMASDDVIAKSALFLQGAAKYAFGSGANTLCEAFVEQMEGRSDREATAYVAAQRRIASGAMQFTMPPPPGAEVYFGPSADNEYDGHVGISLGNGEFRSVTSAGIRDASITAWSASSAPLLGWVPAGTPMYAAGTDWHPGGLAIVGERGPELVDLPRGSSVTPNGSFGGALGLDYDRLAVAIARQRITLVMDRRTVGAAIRTDGRWYNAANPATTTGTVGGL